MLHNDFMNFDEGNKDVLIQRTFSKNRFFGPFLKFSQKENLNHKGIIEVVFEKGFKFEDSKYLEPEDTKLNLVCKCLAEILKEDVEVINIKILGKQISLTKCNDEKSVKEKISQMILKNIDI